MLRRLVVLLPLLGLPALALTLQVGAAVPLPGFRSPTGNLHCLYVPGAHEARDANLFCGPTRADYATNLQAHCIAPPTGLDWHGFQLGATQKGAVVCSGGIFYNPSKQRPTYPVLPYGSTWRHGPFTCRSSVLGVTCRNRHGNGIFLSRESWRVW